MNILFASSEVAPFSKTGGLGDVAWALPRALAARGHRVAVLTPLYGSIDRKELRPLGRVGSWGRLHRWAQDGLEVLFLEDDRRFGREGIYGEGGEDYPDNAERFGHFSRALLPMAEAAGFPAPDILHLNDWQTGLAALELWQRRRRGAGGPRSVFTIHNLGYQGNFPPDEVEALGIAPEHFRPERAEFYGSFSFLKAGLVYADWLTTVSPTYAREIQESEKGFGLDGVLRRRADRLRGIVNGIDEEVWDPSRDSHLVARYDADAMEGKRRCKEALLAAMGIDAIPERMLVGVVARFVHQKGFDLLLDGIDRLMRRHVSLAVLGTGEPRFEAAFLEAARRWPGRIGVRIGFDERKAHRVISGSDVFLMPSRYEPCGLAQMYALRYGTPPIVRATGGLADTVEEASESAGTGFRFVPETPEALLGAIDDALALYASPETWRALQRRGMARDSSWDASAAAYESVYAAALAEEAAAATFA